MHTSQSSGLPKSSRGQYLDVLGKHMRLFNSKSQHCHISEA